MPSLLLPSRVRPSYKQGYARSAAESAHPNIRKGLHGNWAFALGPTGLAAKDVSGRKRNGVLTDMDAATDWVPGDPSIGGYALDFVGTGTTRVVIPERTPANPTTLTIRVRRTGNIPGNGALVWYAESSGGADYSRFYTTGGPGLKISVRDNDRSLVTGTDFTLTLNQWHTCSWIIHDDYSSIYWDGVLHETLTPVTTFQANYLERIGGTGASGQTMYGQVASVMEHDRVLSLSEMRFLHEQPLAPLQVRRRNYFATAVAETFLGGSTTRISNVRPSYKQGYARSTAESAYPNLRKGLQGLWVPALGPTGVTLRDVSGRSFHGTLTNVSDLDAAWVPGDPRSGGYAVNLVKASAEYVDLGPDLVPLGNCSIVVVVKPISGDNGGIIGALGDQNTKRGGLNQWSGNLEFDFGGQVAGTSRLSVAQPADWVGAWHHVVLTAETGKGMALWYDGSVLTSHAGNTPTRVAAVSSAIGMIDDITSDCRVSHAAIYDRVLSPSEVLSWHEQPNAPLRVRRRLHVSSVAAETGPFEWRLFPGGNSDNKKIFNLSP